MFRIRRGTEMTTYSPEQFENLLDELEFICGGGIRITNAHGGGSQCRGMDSAKDLIDEISLFLREHKYNKPTTDDNYGSWVWKHKICNECGTKVIDNDWWK